MKKFYQFALLGAIALTGMVGFTACSSEEEVDVNPTFDGQSVKTAFALNIPYAGGTRMTEEITQHNSNFRGMQDMFLFPLSAAPNGSTVFPYVNIDLGDLSTSEISTSQSSKIYADVNIAVGTSNFLFYAEATHSDLSTKDQKFDNGILTKTVDPSLAGTNDISFDLNQVSTSSTETTATENALLAILNGVADVEYNSVKWNTLTYSSTDTKFQALVELYNEYTKNNRNASGPNVLRTMQSLYNNAYYIKKRTANDADVVGFCNAIMEKIAYYFSATYDSSKDGVASTSSPDYLADCYTLAWGSVYTDLEKDFPMNTYRLPYGVAEVDFNTTSKHFEYSHNTTGVGTYGSNLKQEDISYPASLQYYCNTPAKATNKIIQTTGEGAWPVTTATWDNDSYWADWTNSVTPSSRSIALRNNIHYGVARLAATVKCANATVLKDNSQAGGGAENDIDVTIPADGFTVTGFLIGGQPQQVGWNFLPVSGTNRSRVVYDKSLNETMAAKQNAATGVNYTLLLDNYNPGGEQEKVNIAVELVNNSTQDFYGIDGLIKAGQTFYLIGQMDPDGQTVTWPNGTYENRFPAKGTMRVFIQDYTTTCNMTIKNLKNAYSTIPDLRVARLQLGLSVDLTWRPGVTYEIDL